MTDVTITSPTVSVSITQSGATEVVISPVGAQGPVGPGSLPAGGEAAQLLTKNSGTNYDAVWGMRITVSGTEPTSPSVGDLWVDTN